jgi:hypothetical protein
LSVFLFLRRLLADGSEVFVCCDESLPLDTLHAAFQHMQS